MPDFTKDRTQRAFVALVVFKRQILTPVVMKNSPEVVRALLSVFSDNLAKWQDVAKMVMKELVDGQRNLLHVAIDVMAPSTKKPDKYSESECRKSVELIGDAVSIIYDEKLGKELQREISRKLDAQKENNARSSVIRKPSDVFVERQSMSSPLDAFYTDFDPMNLSMGKSRDSCLSVLISHPLTAMGNALAKMLKVFIFGQTFNLWKHLCGAKGLFLN